MTDGYEEELGDTYFHLYGKCLSMFSDFPIRRGMDSHLIILKLVYDMFPMKKHNTKLGKMSRSTE